MRLPRLLSTIGFAAGLLVAAGCGAASPAPGANTMPAGRLATAAQATPPAECGKYGACSVEACFGYICIAYATDGSVQAELTSGLSNAQGIATDRQGNAYIADSGNSEIFEYGPYFKGLIKTYQDYGQVPLDVDVDAKTKLLAVSNKSTTGSGAGSVSVYAGGATTPTATLSDPDVPDARGIGIAIDRHGNCFWSLYDPGSGRSKIDEFSACQGSPTAVVSGKHALAGMAFDRANNLYYVVYLSGSANHDIFKCKGTIHCRVLGSHFVGPLIINFDNKWDFLWIDDVGGPEGPLIESINPKTGYVTSSFRAGSSTDPPFGVAHAPGPAY